MTTYNLEQISTLIGKNANVVEQWFEKLEETINHNVQSKDGQKIYDEDDLNIVSYISEKREEKWTYEDIIKQVGERFTIRPKETTNEMVYNSAEDNWNSASTDEKVSNYWDQDPENLFYQVAQDNEIIHEFKYHSLRVMFLTSTLAKRLECYNEDLRIAAMLHDIGKMGISKNILMKSEKLTELEFTIIQSHSHVGNVIVRKHLGLTKAAKFIRDHHERWDGTGYPRRLLGDEITVQGRIISICDAFDTMTVDQRNYKNSTLTHEEAFEELRRCSWTQFDGRLVEMFIEMMDEVSVPEYMRVYKH